MKTYNVGVSPSSLIVNEDIAYVCNSNNYGIPQADSVSVLDLKKGRTKKIIYDTSFNQPYRAAFNHKKTKVYVTNSASPSVVGEQGTVTIIDVKTNTVDGVITGFDGPSAIVVTKKFIYVTNYGAAGGLGSGNGKSISVVNIKTGIIIATITTDLAPAALALSPCGKFLYCLNYTLGTQGTGTINIIDIKTNIITNTISGFFGPFGIAVNKDNIAYVTNFGSNNFSPFGDYVSVVDMDKKLITKNIYVGIQPAGVCISNDDTVYVSTYNALYADIVNFKNLTYGESTIVKLRKNKVVETIKAGQTISTITISDNKLYMTSYTQNIVQSLDL